jgi:hypothetical protein
MENTLCAYSIFCYHLMTMEQKNINVHSGYTASSRTDLLRYLKQQDITVPVQTEGRTSQHCERWGVFRLLATWAAMDYLSYPLRVVHQDKPDFLLSYDEREVGIEFTEAVSQEWAETKALAKQEGEEVFLLMDQFKRGTPKRTTSERRELIRNLPCGDGWADDEPEREWARWMMDCVLAKTKSFGKPRFEKYDKNWLLIYDNLPVQFTEIEDIEVAVGYLMVELNSYWPQKNRYDGILIETGNQLIEISGWNQQPIIDLWT